MFVAGLVKIFSHSVVRKTYIDPPGNWKQIRSPGKVGSIGLGLWWVLGWVKVKGGERNEKGKTEETLGEY